MLRLPVQRLFRCAMAALIVAASLAAATTPAGAQDEPTITIRSGGFGHGVGMSQYGALGRAEDGQTHAEILGFYYAGASLESVTQFEPFATADDVDVLIETRSGVVSVSQPFIDGAYEAGWEVEIHAAGELVTTATESVEASFDGAVWSATIDDDDDPGTARVELCDETCTGTLEFAVIGDGTHAVLEEGEDGDNIGNQINGKSGAYAGGRIILVPGEADSDCGSGTTYCLIHGDLDLQEYLLGVAEIPKSWPEAAQAAQAVAARSYAAAAIVNRAHLGRPWDVVDSTQDQFYAGYQHVLQGCGNWCAGVAESDDEVLVFDGAIAQAFYSSSNGGHTTKPSDVWSGGADLGYLPSKPDPFDGHPTNPNRWQETVLTVQQVSSYLNAYVDPITGDQLHVGTVRDIEISDAPPSGWINYATVTITGTDKTVVVEDEIVGGNVDSGPYGYRFWFALNEGCQADPTCDKRIPGARLEIDEIVNFIDVEPEDFFYEPVQWMVFENLTTGITDELFGPYDDNSRAHIATFIWRFAGEPPAPAPSIFADVEPESFYGTAVSWMSAAELTTGTSETEFSPDDTVTRAEAAAFLWRLAGRPGSDQTHEFTDVPDGRFFTAAVRWMVEHDITTGTSPTTFEPDRVLSRGEIATFLWRLAGKPEAFADGVELPPNMRLT